MDIKKEETMKIQSKETEKVIVREHSIILSEDEAKALRCELLAIGIHNHKELKNLYNILGFRNKSSQGLLEELN